MLLKRLGLIGLATGLGLGLAGCVSDGYGYGGGEIGYASDGYYGAGYDGYDGYSMGGYGSYFGWYGDYYYPGSGFYVYDRNRRPHRWNEGQQRYWQSRQQYRGGQSNAGGANWQGFRQRGRGGNPGSGPSQSGFGRNGAAVGNPSGYRGNSNAAGGRGFRGGPRGTVDQFRGGTSQAQSQAGVPQAPLVQAGPARQPGADQGYRSGGERFGAGNRGAGGMRGDGGARGGGGRDGGGHSRGGRPHN